ncbi:universal stress protein [Limisalsivibrio acetivorans]|uniref:universal stress protein n=1 Tax=Limisalsivibrio acetivorans TaxID=1304888 RepID=UPI0003B39F04|nr:universal stress protein [Limisalsivibrio acetivorans]
MKDIKKIIYPTDFSEPSRTAFDYAVSMAKMCGAQLEILHVMFDETQVVSFYLPQVTMQNLSVDIEEGAKKEMKKFVEESGELGDIEYTYTLKKGTPFVEIIKHAKESGADMIVIGTHGRSGLEHVLFGSTAEKVVRKASCPVLTIRSNQEDFKLP